MSLGRAVLDLDGNLAPLAAKIGQGEAMTRSFLASAAAGMRGASGATDEAASSANRLSGAWTDANGRLRDADGRFLAMGKSAQGSSAGIMNAALSLDKLGGALTKVGGGITVGITLPVAAALKSAVSLAAGYQQTMSVLQAATSASDSEMARLSATAKQLGADVKLPGTSAKDAGQAMLELGKAGLSVNDIMGASRGVLQLAAAAQTDNATAATYTANALQAFGLAGSQATHVADLLAAAANASSAEIGDVAQGMQQAAVVFAGSHQSVDDLATSLALMANNGIKGSDAGTSLKTMLQRLVAPTDEAKSVMDDYGLSIFDASGQMRPWPEIIGQLQTAFGGLSDEQRNAALNTVFGADAIRAANVFVKAGVTGYNDLKGAVTEAGAAQKMAEAQTKGLSGTLDGLKSTLETAALAAGEKLLPYLTSLAGGVTDLIGWVSQLNPNLLYAAAGFVGVLAVLGPIALGLGIIIPLISGLTLALGGIALVAAGAGAGIILLVRNWDTVTEKLPELQLAADGIKTALSDLWLVAQAVFPGIANVAMGAGKILLGELQTWLGALHGFFDGVAGVAALDGERIKQGMSEIGDAVERGVGTAVDGASDIKAGFGDVATSLANLDFEHTTKSAAELGVEAGILALQMEANKNKAEANAQALLALDQRYQILGASVAESAVALDHWNDIQGSIDQNVQRASESIGFWQQNLDETDTALGYLNDQIERGEPLSEQQQAQYDNLTWGAARLTGGIEDQQGAYVDAADAQITFMRKQDELNAALADGTINNEQYNEAVSGAREEYHQALGPAGEMADSQDRLADAMGKVIDRLEHIMVALGILPPEVSTDVKVDTSNLDTNLKVSGDEIQQFSSTTGKATVDVDTTAVTTGVDEAQGDVDTLIGPPYTAEIQAETSGFIGPVLDAQTNVDTLIGPVYTAQIAADNQDALDHTAAAAKASIDYATADYQAKIEADPSYAQTDIGKAQADAIAYATAQYEAYLKANNADALSKISDVQGALSGLPTSFTIYAQLDYTAFDAGIKHVAGYTPQSPAKEGPLSKVPDWSFLTWTLAPTLTVAAQTTADGGSRMMASLDASLTEGGAVVGNRMREIATEHGRVYGNRVRESAEEALGTAPTLGQLILDAVAAGMDPVKEQGGLAGKDIVDALVKGVVAGQDEWQNVFDLLHGDALTALAEMQTDLQGQIRLGEIAGDDTSDLQAKLDAISQIIATWAAQTGLDFNEEVASILAPDLSDPITKAWLDLLDNIDEIVSGEFQKGLQDQLAKVQNELTVAQSTGAPQAVIDALLAQQAAIEAQLTEAGLAYQAAIDAGLTDPAAWQKTQDELQAKITDTQDYLSSLADGSAIADAQARMDDLNEQLAVARATGASQEVIAAIMQQFVAAQAAFNQAASDTSELIAAGIASPEAIAAYNEAMGIVTMLPLDQLREIMPQMEDGGLSLIDSLVSGIAAGEASVDDVLALFGDKFADFTAMATQSGVDPLVAASDNFHNYIEQILEDGDYLNEWLDQLPEDAQEAAKAFGKSIAGMAGSGTEDIAQLQESLMSLEDELQQKLAQALIDGTDTTAIAANIAAIEELLAELEAQAGETAGALDTVAAYDGPPLVTHPGSPGSSGQNSLSGGASGAPTLSAVGPSSVADYQAIVGNLTAALADAADGVMNDPAHRRLLDANHDSIVSAEELQAAQQRLADAQLRLADLMQEEASGFGPHDYTADLTAALGGLTAGQIGDAIANAAGGDLNATSADEQLALLQAIAANPEQYVGGAWQQVLTAFQGSLSDLGLSDYSLLDATNAALQAAGVSPLTQAMVDAASALDDNTAALTGLTQMWNAGNSMLAQMGNLASAAPNRYTPFEPLSQMAHVSLGSGAQASPVAAPTTLVNVSLDSRPIAAAVETRVLSFARSL